MVIRCASRPRRIACQRHRKAKKMEGCKPQGLKMALKGSASRATLSSCQNSTSPSSARALAFAPIGCQKENTSVGRDA